MGTAGDAVLAAVVEIAEGTPERLVAVKPNGPPGETVVIFWIATSGMAGLTMLVKIQVI